MQQPNPGTVDATNFGKAQFYQLSSTVVPSLAVATDFSIAITTASAPAA